MILDLGSEVYVWIGSGANAVEKKGALETAMKYVETDTSGRKVDDTSFMQIKLGFEPPSFTAQFHAWDPAKWSNGKSYEELKKEMAAGNAGVKDLATNVQAELAKFTGATYSLAEITGATLPEGMNSSSHVSPRPC